MLTMNDKTVPLAGGKEQNAGWQRAPWPAWAVVMVALVFSLACETAPPPRLMSEAEMAAGNAPMAKARRERTDRSIRSISDLAIPKVDGGALKLADLRGKVVVVDLWATWCGPCRNQAPHLAELSARYRERGLEVVGLSVNDPKKDQAEVAQFIKQASINYTIAYADSRISDAFMRGTEDETGAPPIPQLFVFARDGRLVEHFIGEDPARGLTQLEKVINQQLSLTESPR